ncbi:CRP-like cAMP-activated global transcriptional regulator [uncultured Comamonas sp.]|nr:CRP-like cAMP-activated global transcriptional regulator [uncultured Comamonas sp.]
MNYFGDDSSATADTPWLAFDNLAIWDKVLHLGRPIQWSRGTVIRRPGDPARQMFLICTGLIKVCAISRCGLQRTLWLMGPGSLLGEAALFGHKPYQHEILALQESRAYEFSGPEFTREILTHHPDLSHQLLLNLATKSYISSSQMESSTFLTGSQRIAKLLNGLDELHKNKEVKISHALMAEILGMHRVTVSNAIRLFKKVGFLEETPQGIRVIDSFGLANFVESPTTAR